MHSTIQAPVDRPTPAPASASATARLVPVAGFLGAGKTTALLQLAARMRRAGARPGFLRRAEPVDASVLTSAWKDVPFDSFAGSAASFSAAFAEAGKDRDLVLAELPGDTTPRMFLRDSAAHGSTLAPLSVLVDPVFAARAFNLSGGPRPSEAALYLFRQQLAQADLIVMNKSDLVSQPMLARLRSALEDGFEKIQVLSVSAKSGQGMDEWLDCIMKKPASGAVATEQDSAELLRRAAGALGFLSCNVRLSSIRYFDGAKLLLDLAAAIQAITQQEAAEIAHLKMALRSTEEAGLAVVNLVRNDAAAQLAQDLSEPVQSGELLLTIRAEADPEVLHSAVNRALLAMMEKSPDLFARMEHCEHYRPNGESHAA